MVGFATERSTSRVRLDPLAWIAVVVIVVALLVLLPEVM